MLSSSVLPFELRLVSGVENLPKAVSLLQLHPERDILTPNSFSAVFGEAECGEGSPRLFDGGVGRAVEFHVGHER